MMKTMIMKIVMIMILQHCVYNDYVEHDDNNDGVDYYKNSNDKGVDHIM